MNPQKIKKILQDVKSGKVDPGKAFERLKNLPFEDLGFAILDHHRTLRTGIPEVIYAPGKTAVQIEKMASRMKRTGIEVLITRTDNKTFQKIKNRFHNATFNPDARIIRIPKRQKQKINYGKILVISAGTSDIPVAEEAAVTAEAMGLEVKRIFDVGVAGIHRLLAYKDKLDEAQAIIVVAGMEGALASVVGGLVDVPVIAVPTSVGYGASFNGLSALLSMLNSCVPGVVVVNIDNGFGAACAASLIVKNKTR
ncbi:MAG: 1-(5-phosphoribosyl)-5-amino-4-imidazole-carboxylate carboxylase [candidate division Zixibacteria bacterium 4484_95]|nr:MAG: 1-(5-phosphoribosyl)-5-amino-4-imidazole-carboxylate carboxylase [candidate division Zixibacteria bacterium 4484_95]